MKVKTLYCPHCGTCEEFDVESIDYDNWKAGMLIQNAFPYLTAAQRERLKTGLCDDVFQALTCEDPDDDDNGMSYV